MVSSAIRGTVIASVGIDRARNFKQRFCFILFNLNRLTLTPLHAIFLNPINRFRYSLRRDRKLEIGPGYDVLDGFETVDVVSRFNVTYIGNALRLPVPSNAFKVVYASHIIEHIPWYQVDAALHEWVRALKPGGLLQVWTPNGLRIAKAFVEAEETGSIDFHNDGWWRFNEERDPCKWASGRCFSYGDGTGRNHPNWHRALFSPRHLRQLLTSAGLMDVREMDRSEVRGHDHGWINLGMCGTKSSVSASKLVPTIPKV